MKLIDADDLKRSIRRQAGFIRWAGIDGLTQIADEMEKGFIQEIDKAPVVLEFDGEINRVVVRGEEYFKKPKWIPCSEGLPDVGAILISDGNQMFIGAYYGNNTWSADGCDYDPILENIAWMPLPEPWKGEEE